MWLSIISKMLVYGAGFGSVLLISSYASIASFGLYSIYQSAIELSLIVGTLGSGILFTRKAGGEKLAISRFTLYRVLSIGLPISISLLFVFLNFNKINTSIVEQVIIYLTVLFFCFNVLALANNRGLGFSGLLNVEAGIRSFLLMTGVCGAIFLTIDISPLLLISINLISVVVLTFFLRNSFSKSYEINKSGVGLVDSFYSLCYSILLFLARKSDVLILAIFMPLEYIGAFKIAFLFAESPSQFAQAYMYSETKKMISIGQDGRFSSDYIKFIFKAFFVGVVLLCVIFLFMNIFSNIFNINNTAVNIFNTISLYFLMRIYLAHHEIYLQLNSPIKNSVYRAIFEMLIRISLYYFSWLMFEGRPEFLFLALAFFEFLIYEFSMRMVIGKFPLMIIFEFILKKIN